MFEVQFKQEEEMMDLGILVYVDDSPSMLEEFDWLYKSLYYSGVISRSGIIAVCNPKIIQALPKDERITVIPSIPYEQRHAEWSGYKFINSIGNLIEQPVLDACAQFEFILKTDCDTFVTPALRDFRPSGLCAGFGGYAYQDDVREKLSEVSARWGFPHSGLHNVGASVLGPAEMVKQFLLAQMRACERLWREEFQSHDGVWPGWCKQVVTMYAGELALRVTYPQRCSLGLLDTFPSADRELASDVLHIHAWQTEAYWSKRIYREGGYAHIARDSIDRTKLAGYCHWLAEASIDEVKRAAQ